MDEEFAEINITPFTDILLVLLIIFMILAALVVPPGFERALANPAPPTVTNAQPPRLAVTITAAGQMFVGRMRTSEAGIYALLAQRAAHDRRLKLGIVADARAKYALVIRVLDAAKSAGITDVSFVSE